MGYYTCHTMTAQNCPEATLERVNAWLDDHHILDYALMEGRPALNDPYEASWDCVGECKWYSTNEDMEALSKAFPEVTFCLHGEGEEREDVWDLYCKDGTLESCVSTWYIPAPKQIQWN